MITETVMAVAIVLSVCCLLARLYMLRGMIGLSIRQFLNKVAVNVAVVSCIAALIPYLLTKNFTTSFTSFAMVSLVALISSVVAIYFAGCNKSERQFVKDKIKTVTNKIHLR